MSTESSSDYDAASEATETEGEGELGFGQEHSQASELNGWREAVTRLISVDSCVLAYMSNCIRLTDIDYGAFLQHADKEYDSTERTFALYLERKRGLDAGSLKALAASDSYWNERTCHDYEQVEERRQVPGEPSESSSSHGAKDVRQGMQKRKGKQARELSASNKRLTSSIIRFLLSRHVHIGIRQIEIITREQDL
ncbi:hypothetical protein BGZ97_008127 [Linnemannia gamsii]|uniref:Uncharacterized protein n=1 Tax=Linnemannia gamsii TaxID=64522 RepID=A0A9P6QRG4_9FUNG|nr:hypothetical protein BGZ97_008127 [Linnemannia gamsii]